MLTESIVARGRRHAARIATLLATAILGVSGTATAGHGPDPGQHLAALNGHSQPTIYFVDFTDATWPVSAAATEWDRSSKLTVERRSSCPNSGDYCPSVTMVYTTAWAGRTIYRLNAEGTHISRSGFTIELSNATPTGNRRSAACHEEGHALGLKHRLPADSCMRADGVWPSLPDAHDFDQLWLSYNHTH